MKLAYIEDLGDRLVVVNANDSRRNALSDDLYDVLIEAMELAADTRITSVTLWGEGFFCAGGDLNLLAKRSGLTLDERKGRIDALHDLIRGIRACPKPVIAAVEAGAAGAGASIAFACDMIVATEGAKFSAAYVKAGLVPDAGLSASLTSLLPRALVSEMMLLGDAVLAERLVNLGAINAVVPLGQARSAAMALADRFSKGPSVAQARIKAMIGAAHDNSFADQLDYERDEMAMAIVAPEAQEGINAFLNKRQPDFTKLRSE